MASASSKGGAGSADDIDPFQMPDDSDQNTSQSGARPPQSSQERSSASNKGSDVVVGGPESTAGSSYSASRPSSYHQHASSDNPAPSNAPSIDMSTLTITDAQKTTDHVGAATFIAYVIRCGSTEAKRRYSEFEALRSALVKLHPTLIIPPIPDKHTLSDYAVKQSKAKEDATIIARRKRMLQSFLLRCAAHPQVKDSEVLRKFLDGRWSWHEIATTPPISNLPKSNLKAPATNPADPNASPAYASLPLPASSATQLRNPSQRFLDSEAFTNRFATHMSQSLERGNRRVARRWADASGDFAELGAVLNGFSLSESGQLSTAIERAGQAADSTYMSIGGLLQDWEQSLTEPLHEYVQFAAVLQNLLKWRHLKHLQFELAQDALEAKKVKLEELERIEEESRRLERALESGGRSLTSGPTGRTGGGSGAGSAAGAWDSSRAKSSIYGGADDDDDAHQSGHNRAEQSDNSTRHAGHNASWSDGIGGSISTNDPSRSPPTASRQPSSPSGRSSRGGGSGYGLLSSITSSFSSMLDVDPETTRRREISRLREEILSLDEALKLTSHDLKFATVAIQTDLDRFQRGKVADFKEMMLRAAKMHREFCRVNLENWKEAKSAIDSIQHSTRSVNEAATSSWPTKTMPESSLPSHERQRNENQSGRPSSSRSRDIDGDGSREWGN